MKRDRLEAVASLPVAQRAAHRGPAGRTDVDSAAPTLDLGGLRLPAREVIVVAIATFALLIDWYHSFLSIEPPLLAQSLDRLLLYGVLPLGLAILVGLRPRDMGLRLGGWGIGLVAVAVGVAVATPVILVVGGLPEFRAYYGRNESVVGELIVAHALDAGAAEFLYRGFLMMAIIRLCGPMGVVLATFPFVFTHLGKPELETLSTLFGGTAFGWIAWRTGSVLYGAALHAFIMTLMVVAASR
jgi:membrane protease YdiL (CAAX protease family)